MSSAGSLNFAAILKGEIVLEPSGTGARYYSLSRYLRGRFGCRVARIPLDGGLGCPNRDGALSSQGCIFCNEKGSGTGAAGAGLTVAEQLEQGLQRFGRRAERFMAYFQAFTNTYAPPERLKGLWDQALTSDRVVGLAVATRPDCLEEEALALLSGYAESREVWLELGLQSASDKTLALINRGHTAADFARAIERSRGRGLKLVAHVILGLPGEGEAEMDRTAAFLGELGLDGVKIHSLYICRDTALAGLYAAGRYACLGREEYVQRAVHFLEHLPPDMVIHRLTGDPAPDELVAPDWSRNKQQTLRSIRERLAKLDTWQGRRLGAPRPEPG